MFSKNPILNRADAQLYIIGILFLYITDRFRLCRRGFLQDARLQIQRDDIRGGVRLLVILKRGQLDLRATGVGPVDRLRVMPQRLLGEPLGIPAHLRPLRPGVSVGMQRNPLDLEPTATAPELLGAMLLMDLRQAREEQSGAGQPPQNRLDLPAEVQDRQRRSLLAPERNNAFLPFDVLCGQRGDVGSSRKPWLAG